MVLAVLIFNEGFAMYYYIKEKGKQPSPTLFIMERAGAN